jgi:hypothetical protein
LPGGGGIFGPDMRAPLAPLVLVLSALVLAGCDAPPDVAALAVADAPAPKLLPLDDLIGPDLPAETGEGLLARAQALQARADAVRRQ